MIAIIDYGVGNLFSLRSSLTHLGLEAVVTADAQTIRKADRLILPGVGAFGDAMDKLSATGLVPVIREQAAQKPLLGICLGMQLLFEKSYEYGEHGGLGFVKGEVCPLEPDLKDKTLKVPQIGWNALHIVRDDPLFRYIREGEYVYYVHSYYGKNCTESTLAVSDYSIPVTGVVRAGRVYGATRFEATLPFLRSAVIKSFSPCIANMAVLGIVSFPGTMIGQILGGSIPEVAIKYQLMISVITVVASMLSLVITISFSVRRTFDGFGRLKPIFRKGRNTK